MKIEIAQISTDPGSIEKNTKKIIDSIKIAQGNGANMVVFPELTIPGYASMDLLGFSDFIKKNIKALDLIAPYTKNITAIVGFVDSDLKKKGPDGQPIRFNSAAIIQNGKLMGVENKSLLPDYDVFYENRYFQTREKRQIYECMGTKFGVEICEDLWDENYALKVTDELARMGAELIINLSASPFYVGKAKVREKLIKKAVKRLGVNFVYVNLVGSYDGYDGQLVFDGQSVVVGKNGQIVGTGKAFCEDNFYVDLQVKNISSNARQAGLILVDQLYQALILGIRDYFRQAGFKKAYIGLSGGIDSALVAALAVEALGSENVTGLSMPSMVSSQGSKTDALMLADNLNIKLVSLPVSAPHKSIEEVLAEKFEGGVGDITNQNIQARIRGLYLMAYANQYGGMVISTGNKTEMALGYCTLYGDMAGGLAAIADVDKLWVYKLARYINKKAKKEIIPKSSISKPPSAELSANQTDENSLGANYKVIVPIVNRLVEKGETIEKVARDYSIDLVEKYWKLIKNNEHKRRQAPPGIKVSQKSFGVGRRIPLNYEFKQ